MDKGDGSGLQRSVLVVDDEEGIRKVLKRHLTQLGYEVALAANADEALALAERLEPSVIVTDVHMPGIDGHELLRRLSPLGLHSSVILMSGRGELDDAISAMRQGAVDYLKKPWTLQELTSAVGRATQLFDALRDLGAPPASDPVGGSRVARGARGANEGRIDAAKVVRELAEKGDAIELPVVSSSLARMRDLAERPGTRVDDPVLDLLEPDAGLVSSIFRMAGERPSAQSVAHVGLRDAAAAVGVAAIRSEVETAAIRSAFPIGVPAVRALDDRIQEFTLARAQAMRGIAEIAEPKVVLETEDCYLAGLWLDVGATYLLSAISAVMLRRGGKVADPAEMNRAIATHHGAVGASILRRWGMSADVVELTYDHHGDARSRHGQPLWCAATLGGAIALRITGFSDPTGDRDLTTDVLARCAYTLGVGDTSLRHVTRSLANRAGHLSVAGSP